MSSRFTIDGFEFNTVTGVLNLPRTEVVTYRTPTSYFVGVQTLAGRAKPSVLQVKRYGPASDLDYLHRSLLALQGRNAIVIDGTVNYSWPPHLLRFVVSQIEVEVVDKIPGVLTNLNNQAYHFSPAARIVAKITLEAQPIT